MTTSKEDQKQQKAGAEAYEQAKQTQEAEEDTEKKYTVDDMPDNLTHKELWRDYFNNPTEEHRNRLVEEYLSLVHYCAERVNDRLPNSVDVKDLKHNGVMGLFDAIEKYDPDRGVKFKTYSTMRIRGSILDSLRSEDWVPRLIRKRSHKYKEAVQKLEAEKGRRPTDLEIAEKMELSLNEFDELQREISTSMMFSLTQNSGENDDDKLENIDRLEDNREPQPDREVFRKDLLDYIGDQLTKKERLVLMLYYVEELTMKEIGETLGLSESRICQIHSKLLTDLQARLSDKKEELMDAVQ